MLETVPKFPDFRLFNISDIKWYYDYYCSKNLNPYADINPENLFVWLNMNDDLMISELNDDVVIRYTNVLDNNRINIIPLANPIHNSSLEKIMSYLKENNLPLELNEIPSISCHDLDNTKWQVEDDRNSYEYILDTQQQSVLEGKEFSRQRRRINFFEREHLNEPIDIQYYIEIDEQVKDIFLHHIDTMPFNSNSEASQKNSTEPIAIRKNLDYAAAFHKKALIIKIDGQVVSLAIISYLDKNTAAINHIKVDYSVQYIFQYTIYRLAKILQENGISEMNIEQDLGIEGLRTFKERLQPSRFLKKNIIRPLHL